MGKQVLEKCLNPKPQSEKNVDFVTAYSRSILIQIAASGEKVTGKMNRPKTSVNTVVGYAQGTPASPTVNLTI